MEIAKSPGANLGITLTSATYRNKQVIIIDKIKAASVVDRWSSLPFSFFLKYKIAHVPVDVYDSQVL